jgi:hypothetical protein
MGQGTTMKSDLRRGGCAGVVLPALLLMLLVSGCAQTHYFIPSPLSGPETDGGLRSPTS